MRFLGVLMLLLGSVGTGYCTWAALHRGRPMDVVFSALAPVAVGLALIGLALVFVPGFLG